MIPKILQILGLQPQILKITQYLERIFHWIVLVINKISANSRPSASNLKDHSIFRTIFSLNCSSDPKNLQILGLQPQILKIMTSDCLVCSILVSQKFYFCVRCTCNRTFKDWNSTSFCHYSKILTQTQISFLFQSYAALC